MELPQPVNRIGKNHVTKLSDILLLTVCAVISGANSWEDIEDFGETHIDFLK
ncbi:transposase family protein [Salmonella enterica]|nr:transposase family protein [Salmonella enterica]